MTLQPKIVYTDEYLKKHILSGLHNVRPLEWKINFWNRHLNCHISHNPPYKVEHFRIIFFLCTHFLQHYISNSISPWLSLLLERLVKKCHSFMILSFTIWGFVVNIKIQKYASIFVINYVNTKTQFCFFRFSFVATFILFFSLN